MLQFILSLQVTEYTSDGQTASHVEKIPIPIQQDNIILKNQVPTLEDKINYIYYKIWG